MRSGDGFVVQFSGQPASYLKITICQLLGDKVRRGVEHSFLRPGLAAIDENLC